MVTTSVENEFLIAHVTPNINHPDQFVAFIGKQLCFFEKDVDTSKFKKGDEIEVMVTRALYHLHPKDHAFEGRPNFHQLKALMIVPLNKEIYTLITLPKGFKEDPNTKIVSSIYVPKGKRKEYTILSGKTNVMTHLHGDTSPPPIKVWVKTEEISAPPGEPISAVGLNRISDGRWASLLR